MFAVIQARAGAGRRGSQGRRRPEHEVNPQLDAGLEGPATLSAANLSGFALFRLRTHDLLEDPSSSQAARAMSVFILLTIMISIVNFMIASYPEDMCIYADDTYSNPWAPEPKSGNRLCAQRRMSEESTSQAVESVCIIIFTVEYLLRFLVCTARISPLRFLVDPLNLLDVLAIMPWYLDIIVGSNDSDEDGSSGGGGIFGVLRIVRLTRVLRVFKVSRSMQSMIVLARTIVRSFSAFMILLTSIFVCMLLFGSFLVFFERGTYNEDLRQYLRADGTPSPFLSIPHCMYWCMVRASLPTRLSRSTCAPASLSLSLRFLAPTHESPVDVQTTMTTVGYGDLYPVTEWGKIIAMFAMVSG